MIKEGVYVVNFEKVYDTILDEMNITKEDVHHEIKKFLTEAIWNDPSLIYSDPDFNQPDWIDTLKNAVHELGRKTQIDVLDELPAQDQEYVHSLKKAQRDWYMFFSGASCNQNFTVNFTYMTPEQRNAVKELLGDSSSATIDWNGKCMAQDWKHYVLDHCPLFVEFINKLPFEERGLVQMMGVLPNNPIPNHNDITDWGKKVDDFYFMYFGPDNMPKHINIFEDGEYVKHNVKCMWFSDNNLHGVDPIPYFTYNVRVDGRFDRNILREKYGIDF